MQLRQRIDYPMQCAKLLDHPLVNLRVARDTKPKHDQLQVIFRGRGENATRKSGRDLFILRLFFLEFSLLPHAQTHIHRNICSTNLLLMNLCLMYLSFDLSAPAFSSQSSCFTTSKARKLCRKFLQDTLKQKDIKQHLELIQYICETSRTLLLL